jgi:hypothetical protein
LSVGAIDDVSVFSHGGLRTQLATKELGGICSSDKSFVSESM